MKKFFKNIMGGVLGLYIVSFTVMMPFYNWQYAKEHGIVKWLLFGEIVATLKSTVWPYFVFVSEHNSSTNFPDERHYVNSKKACDEAMKIIIKTGDVAHLSFEDKMRAVELFELAIAEAEQVSSDYLQKVHPQFPKMYEGNYKYAMNLLIWGFRNDNTALVLAGTYGYNEFVEWVKMHAEELSF